jgi:hypothetical protein
MLLLQPVDWRRLDGNLRYGKTIIHNCVIRSFDHIPPQLGYCICMISKGLQYCVSLMNLESRKKWFHSWRVVLSARCCVCGEESVQRVKRYQCSNLMRFQKNLLSTTSSHLLLFFGGASYGQFVVHGGTCIKRGQTKRVNYIYLCVLFAIGIYREDRPS